MSDETQNAEDPSIEEILDSIRQIISEDDDGEGEASEPEAAAEAAVPEEATAEEPAADPMEQSAIDDIDFDSSTEEEAEATEQSAIDDIDFDSPTEEENPEEDVSSGEDVLELTERIEGSNADSLDVDMVDKEETEETEEIVAPEPPPEVTQVSGDDGLLTQQAESAAFEAVSELVRKTAVEHNGITLEDIVREELKPLLRNWLDKNLPIIIDRLVKDELARVTKRVLDE